MPDIRVVQPHTRALEQVKERLGGFRELLAKYRIRMEWEGSHARIGGVPGVAGTVEVRAAEVEVRLTLSRMVTMLGLDPARLETSIRRRLQEALGD